MEFICYPKCSTCKKAQNFLDSKNIKYDYRDIKLNPPKEEELSNYINKYNINVNKLFNTSGLVYRELNLKDKLNEMSKDEKIKLLSSNGMLIKRPLLITDDIVLIGFKLNEWESYFR